MFRGDLPPFRQTSQLPCGGLTLSYCLLVRHKVTALKLPVLKQRGF